MLTQAARGDVVGRFWQNVDKTGDCWLWLGGRNGDGYGSIRAEGNKKKSVHRLSYEIHFGPIPPGHYVCHSCDNPTCVRPDHLWPGTKDWCQIFHEHDDIGPTLDEYAGGGTWCHEPWRSCFENTQLSKPE